jgi:hypothetical protein
MGSPQRFQQLSMLRRPGRAQLFKVRQTTVKLRQITVKRDYLMPYLPGYAPDLTQMLTEPLNRRRQKP